LFGPERTRLSIPMNALNTLFFRLLAFFSPSEEDREPTPDENRERLAVAGFALILAIFLWFWVKMGRDYTVRLPMKVEVATLPSGIALRHEVPDEVTVSLSGEGWELLSWAINPAVLSLGVEEETVVLTDQIRQQIAPIYQLTLNDVEPSALLLDLEPLASKKVPVSGAPVLEFRTRFGPITELELLPDSVTITGGESRIRELESWSIRPLTILDISGSIRRLIPLQSSPGLTVTPEQITLVQEAAEFTEGEVRIPIQTRRLPLDLNIEFTPAFITVRYLIPIEEYDQIRDRDLFEAIVTAEMLVNDSSGYITPQINPLIEDLSIRIQSLHPAQITYFEVVE